MMRLTAPSLPTLALGLMVLMGISSTTVMGRQVASVESCPPRFVDVAGLCLQFVQQALSVDRAVASCQASDSVLVEIESFRQKEAIVNHVNQHYGGQYWTSGESRSGDYYWHKFGLAVPQAWRGRNFSFGNNRCVYLCSYTRKLWDSPCSTAKKFICQYERRVQEAEAY